MRQFVFARLDDHTDIRTLVRMRALVTGAAGFIGSHLAKHFADLGYDVVAADAFKNSGFENLANFDGDVLTLRDATDIDSLRRMGKFDLILHQASITGVVGPAGEDLSDTHHMLATNVETFRHLLDWAVETKARVVWASSCSVYGRGAVPMRESQKPDPLNAYAFSKLLMEHMAGRYATRLAQPIVGLRYSNAYGPGEAHKGKLASMIYQLAKQMRTGNRPRIFEHGQQKRDFVYIDDVVAANVKASQAKFGGVFNAGAGKSWSFNDVVAELNRVLKTDLQPEYFSNPYAFTQDWTECDMTRAKEAIGHVPECDLHQGIGAYHESGKLGV